MKPGDRVAIPTEGIFLEHGHSALVIGQENDNWILWLDPDDPPADAECAWLKSADYGPKVLLWPVDRENELVRERVVEFVFRVKTNMDRGALDDLLGHASETLFPDYRDEEELTDPYAVYVPTGSHWRDVGVDPAAADLSGGNRVSA